MGFLSLLSARAWASIGLVALVTGAAWSLYNSGYRSGVSATEGIHAEAENIRLKDDAKALAAHIKRAGEEARALALKDAEFSEAYEIYRTRVVTKVEEVTREVPADCATCRISPVGLSLINAARAARLPMAPDTGEPDAAVSAPPTASDGNAAGTRWRVFTGQPSAQRLRGEALATDPSGEEAGI